VLYTYFQVGRTERINNCLNPQFSKPFELDYFFEEVQRLCFKVYDLDNDTASVSDDDFLGQIECTLGEVNKPC
jgi:C2 domain